MKILYANAEELCESTVAVPNRKLLLTVNYQFRNILVQVLDAENTNTNTNIAELRFSAFHNSGTIKSSSADVRDWNFSQVRFRLSRKWTAGSDASHSATCEKALLSRRATVEHGIHKLQLRKFHAGFTAEQGPTCLLVVYPLNPFGKQLRAIVNDRLNRDLAIVSVWFGLKAFGTLTAGT